MAFVDEECVESTLTTCPPSFVYTSNGYKSVTDFTGQWDWSRMFLVNNLLAAGYIELTRKNRDHYLC